MNNILQDLITIVNGADKELLMKLDALARYPIYYKDPSEIQAVAFGDVIQSAICYIYSEPDLHYLLETKNRDALFYTFHEFIDFELSNQRR